MYITFGDEQVWVGDGPDPRTDGKLTPIERKWGSGTVLTGSLGGNNQSIMRPDGTSISTTDNGLSQDQTRSSSFDFWTDVAGPGMALTALGATLGPSMMAGFQGNPATGAEWGATPDMVSPGAQTYPINMASGAGMTETPINLMEGVGQGGFDLSAAADASSAGANFAGEPIGQMGGWEGAAQLGQAVAPASGLTGIPWLDKTLSTVGNKALDVGTGIGINALFGGQGGMGGGNRGLADLLGIGANYYGLDKYRGDLRAMMDKAIDYSDPFHNQRSQYQAKLPGMVDEQSGRVNQYNQDVNQFRTNYGNEYGRVQGANQALLDQFKSDSNQFNDQYGQMLGDYRSGYGRMSDPTYWDNDPMLQGLETSATRGTAAKMSSMGYNMSGNELQEIAKTLRETRAGYANDIRDDYLAGANTFLGNFGQTGLGRLNANLGATQAGLQSNQASLDNYSRTGLGTLESQLGGVRAGAENLGQVSTMAGANFDPGRLGGTIGTLGTAMANAGMGQNQMIGAGLERLLRGVG